MLRRLAMIFGTIWLSVTAIAALILGLVVSGVMRLVRLIAPKYASQNGADPRQTVARVFLGLLAGTIIGGLGLVALAGAAIALPIALLVGGGAYIGYRLRKHRSYTAFEEVQPYDHNSDTGPIIDVKADPK